MSVEGFLSGRVAIITGGGRGVGAAIAHGLAEKGADIVIAARTPSEIESMAANICDMGAVAVAIPADVSNQASIHSLVRRTSERFGHIDILINNAGTLPQILLIEQDTDENFLSGINVDVKGAFYCTQEIVPFMKRQKWGRIVNISAGSAKRASENGPFAMAKAALLSLTRTWAREFGPYNITVNAVAPMLEETRMYHDFFAMAGAQISISQDEAMERMRQQTLIGRSPTGQEIGSFVAYLCSNEAGFLTGQSFNGEGGWVVN